MEILHLPNITLCGYAQGGWQTSICVPELNSTFDIGILLSIKTENYFITHGHPDHIGALPYLIARQTIEDKNRYINIYYPEKIDENLKTGLLALSKIQGDRGDLPVNFFPAKIGDTFKIKKNISVRVLETYHRIPSCGWAIEQTTNKLLPEFKGLSDNEIVRIKNSGKKIIHEVIQTILTIPGDTTIDFLRLQKQAQNSRVLVHEVTSWGLYDKESCTKYGHTHVEDIIEYGHLFSGEILVLVHRSMKHSKREIEEIVQKKFPEDLIKKIKIFDGGDI